MRAYWRIGGAFLVTANNQTVPQTGEGDTADPDSWSTGDGEVSEGGMWQKTTVGLWWAPPWCPRERCEANSNKKGGWGAKDQTAKQFLGLIGPAWGDITLGDTTTRTSLPSNSPVCAPSFLCRLSLFRAFHGPIFGHFHPAPPPQPCQVLHSGDATVAAHGCLISIRRLRKRCGNRIATLMIAFTRKVSPQHNCDLRTSPN